MSNSPFVRWDRDVIDWVRPTAADLWRSTNVRDVRTDGIEISAQRRWTRALVRGYFSGQSVDAPALAVLSKYVLEYAPQSAGLSLVVPIRSVVQAAVNVDWRNRFDGQRYALVGFRVTRGLRRASVYLEGSNLGDVSYEEVAGVPMPGRWISAGLTLR
jgi:iron complex outermembrane receptor protein